MKAGTASLCPYGGANELRLIALIHLRVASRRYFLACALNFYKWPRCILETNGRVCISSAAAAAALAAPRLKGEGTTSPSSGLIICHFTITACMSRS